MQFERFYSHRAATVALCAAAAAPPPSCRQRRAVALLMAAHSHRYHHRGIPRFGIAGCVLPSRSNQGANRNDDSACLTRRSVQFLFFSPQNLLPCTFGKKQSYFLDYTYSDVKLLCTSSPVCCDGSPESSFLLGLDLTWKEEHISLTSE